MKLLVYSHAFAPQIGGVETVVLSLADGLARAGARDSDSAFDVTVVTQTPAGNFDDASLRFRVLRQPTFLNLSKLIFGSDIIHLAGPALAPLFLAWLARKPAVVEHHGFQTICPNGQLFLAPTQMLCPGHYMAGRHRECLRCNSAGGWPTSLRLWLLTLVRRFLSRCASVNIVPTAWLGGMLHLPRATTIPHGIAVPEIDTHSMCSEPPVIAFQGRLVATKGVQLLLTAAKILQNDNRAFELLIIGEGPDRVALEETARQNQLSNCTRFAGHVSANELESKLNRASVLVVPSLAGEVFGLVLVENMARSLPVIASDLGAFVEVLGDAGLTFRSGDAADLACAIARVLDEVDMRARLGKQARRRTLGLFTKEKMIEAHARVYRGLFTRARQSMHGDAWKKVEG